MIGFLVVLIAENDAIPLAAPLFFLAEAARSRWHVSRRGFSRA